MIRRTLLVSTEIVAGFIAGLVLLGVGAAWQLSRGPVSLAYFNDHIEAALTPESGAFSVKIGALQVAWAGWERALDLRITDLTVLGPGAEPLAVVPAVSLSLSLPALARGMVAPTALEVTAPTVTIVRTASGRFEFDMRVAPATEPQRPNVVVAGLIEEFLSPPASDRPLGYLRHFRMVDAQLRLDDRRRGIVWSAPEARIEIARTSRGVDALIDAVLRVDGHVATTAVTVRFDRRNEVAEVEATFAGVRPELLARAVPVPELARLSSLDDTIAGRVTATVTSEGFLHSLAFSLEGARLAADGRLRLAPDGDGFAADIDLHAMESALLAALAPEVAGRVSLDARLSGAVSVEGRFSDGVDRARLAVAADSAIIGVPGVLAGPMVVTGLALRGAAEDDLNTFRLEEAAFEVAGARVGVTGEVVEIAGNLHVDATVALSGLAAARIAEIWPEAVKTSARSWIVDNVTDGVLAAAEAKISLLLPGGDTAQARVTGLSGSARGEKLAIAYFYPLPGATGVDAAITFEQERLDVAFSGGRVGEVRLESGHFTIVGFDQEYEDATIEAVVRGPLAAAAELLDHPRLELIKRLGLKGGGFEGETAVRMTFAFPMRDELEWEEVSFAASATLAGAGLDTGVFDLNLSNGDLTMAVTPRQMSVQGNGRLNGVPVELSWQERFEPGPGPRTAFFVAGRLGPEDRVQLGLPVIPGLAGLLSTTVDYQIDDAGNSVAYGSADLLQAGIAWPLFGLHKPVGVPGTATFTMREGPGTDLRVDVLRLDAGDLSLEAAIELMADLSGIRRVELSRLVFGKNDLSGTVAADGAGGYSLSLNGAQVDLEPLLTERADSVMPTANAVGVPLSVNARFDAVVLREGQVLGPTGVVLRHDGNRLQALAARAAVGEGRLEIRYEPTEPGHRLTVVADNAGGALSALGITDRITGGSLTVNGVQADDIAALSGSFKLENFNVGEVPILARLLQVLSLTGIVSALNQEGLDFVRMDGRFRYYAGTMELIEARSFGSSIGVTAEGLIYDDGTWADVKGTLVPAYTINQTLGKIPILGTILTGGKNEGIFAADYSVRGATGNPDVDVNPLSALVPGFLRNLIGNDAAPLRDADSVTGGQ